MTIARKNPVTSLIDRAALLRNRSRADRLGPVDFLHRLVADEIEDRLAEVNRSFGDVAIVTGMPAFWADAFPGAKIVEDSPELDLEPGAHDLVIHAMALHWAEDPVGQIAQCARALRADGLFIAACPGGRTLGELRDVLTRAEAEVAAGLSPRILPMGEIRDLGALLNRGGLSLPVADQITQTVSYRNLFHLASDLRGMAEVNALAGRMRRPTRRDVLLRAAQIYSEDYPDPDDPQRIRATFDLVFLTGWAPDESQQKPLRPGSAKMSLADALSSLRKSHE
ncbi:methyltransferase domain-containing protein [Paracoccus sp. MBLB3053]|uniref:Methyltransferase domain-containing protein n=1 Tax=Paracoccus aurantius TaxID=3073814 RepID=A0ABU2HQQ1_9RHOB|nr:methyltransferase domain-containing protein [Paracoccus sp. MBLB3053]MDS9466624.1 methyltransferase domain-containing protein [Paracoccus sp. MBLB3053]